MEHNKMAQMFFRRHYPFVIDKEGNIVFITKEYAAVLKRDQKSLLGKRVKDVIPDTRLIDVLENEREIFGEPYKISTGEVLICDYLLLRDENGKVEGACCLSPYFINSKYEQDVSLIERLHKKVNELESEKLRYRQELSELERSKSYLVNLVGETPSMRQLKELINRIADTSLVVLITGETGVGKEVVSNAVHQLSGRGSGRYVKINCAAIPSDLLESELFGYEAGSFSGASKDGKMGKFEFANNGTILLDEIGEMSLDLQRKLLRVLQDGEIVRVGGLTPVKLNVRVICSTNCVLEDMVEKGTFRRDLYYRIKVADLYIPPLRERKEDLGLLCDALIRKINYYHNSAVKGVTDETLELFHHYDWPGNIRELEHLLERACVLANQDYLDAHYFEVLKEWRTVGKLVKEGYAGDILGERRLSFEKNEIIRALIEAKGNKTLAAKALGVSRQTLYEKIKKLDINTGYKSNYDDI
jgi:Transcriptional regulator containing PAS, AAA-type ATPase, and DNA-binding domains